MKKPPERGDNFRLIGRVAKEFVNELEKQIETVKRRGKSDDTPKAKTKR